MTGKIRVGLKWDFFAGPFNLSQEALVSEAVGILVARSKEIHGLKCVCSTFYKTPLPCWGCWTPSNSLCAWLKKERASEKEKKYLVLWKRLISLSLILHVQHLFALKRLHSLRIGAHSTVGCLLHGTGSAEANHSGLPGKPEQIPVPVTHICSIFSLVLLDLCV